MAEVQSSASLSPTRADYFPPDEGVCEAKPSSAFGTLTRHWTTTFSRVAALDEMARPPITTEASLRQIKIQIIEKNPSIYQLLREQLIETQCCTHHGISLHLHHFLDQTLRIPDLSDEIANHKMAHHNPRRPPPPRAVSLFAYLMTTSDSSAASNKRGDSVVSSPVTPTTPKYVSSVAATESLPSGTLTLPSLESSGDEKVLSCSVSLPSLDSSGNQTASDDDSLGGETESSYSSSMCSC
jgi:hypothetical protein